MSIKQNSFNYEVTNKESGSAEIKVYGYIGPWDEVDYKRFQQTFRNIVKENKNMTMRLHCGGGSVLEGLAVYDLIRGSECKVHVIVEGMAASMGSILALAGDTIEMTENAFFMMHEVKAGSYGGKAAMEGALELRNQAEERISKIYKERTTASEETIAAWFNNGKDNWLDAETCLDIKLCDTIIKPKKQRKLDNKVAITNKTPMEAWETLANTIVVPSEKSNQKPKNIAMKAQLVNMLVASGIENLTASSTDEDVNIAFQTVINKAKKADDYKQQLDNFKLENAKAIIDPAVAAGKILAPEKDSWLEMATERPEVARQAIERMVGKPDPNASVARQPRTVTEDPNQPEMLKGREDWSFTKWQEKDPEGLMKLEASHPDAFEKLFNSKSNE